MERKGDQNQGFPKRRRERRSGPGMKKVKKISTGGKMLEAGGVLGDQIRVKTKAVGCSGTLADGVQGH